MSSSATTLHWMRPMIPEAVPELMDWKGGGDGGNGSD